MSYNEMPTISVSSVVLPNKQFSNLEIMNAAKKLSLYGFRGIFWETLSLKNKIKRMWYFKLRFVFWRWYTLGYAVHKRLG